MKKINNEQELFEYLADKITETYNPNEFGDCNEINSTISFFLKQKGFKVKCLAGCVLLDHPLVSNMDEPFNGVFDPRHFWIVLDGKILDFASAQFKEHLDNFNGIPYFNGSCESYSHGENVAVDNEWVDKKIINEWNENPVLKKYKGRL